LLNRIRTFVSSNFGWLAVAAAIFGAAAGIGAFTFHYAHGLSYMSSEPEACRNCHIMNTQFDSWNNSPHREKALCVDCHLPHDIAGKYFAKSMNGYHHSAAFTLQNFDWPIRIKPHNAEILQENCERCHKDMVENIVAMEKMGNGEGAKCVHCHKSVGHGPK